MDLVADSPLGPETPRAVCSICNQEFDPAKKHLCDGCGSTFTPGRVRPEVKPR